MTFACHMNSNSVILCSVRLPLTNTNSIFRLASSAIVLLVCAAADGAEAPKLTLPAAIAEALEKNPEIRALGAEVASARGEGMTSKTWENPGLLAQAGVRNTKSMGQTTSEFHGVFELKQTIEFPGKRRLRRALAEKNVELRQLPLGPVRNQHPGESRHALYNQLASHG